MLDLARVVAAHPESQAVDLEFMLDGRRIAGVQVMADMAGTDFGSSGVYPPDDPGYGKEPNGKRDIIAVVAFVRDHPVVLGFLFPQVSQMLFSDGRWVFRHPSDVYVTIDNEANTEVFHPSGAFLRIGTSPAHEDLTGRDFDKVWAIRRNTDKQAHIHIEQAGGAASWDMAPDGAVVTRSKVSITNEAPLLVFKGRVVQLGGPTQLEGPANVDKDLVAAGISVSKHTHIEQGDGAPVSKPQ